MKAILLALLAVGCALAQTPTVAPTALPAPPSNWYGAGATLNYYTTPVGGGWAAYAKEINEKTGLWQFNLYMASPQKVGGKVSVVTSTTAGFCLSSKQMGPLQIFGCGSGGLATNGGSAGNAFPWGGFADYKIKKTEWHVDGGFLTISTSLAEPTQRVWLVGVGRIF